MILLLLLFHYSFSSTITTFTVSPSSYIVRDSTIYQISFKPGSTMPSGGKIFLTLPSQLSTTSSTCAATSGFNGSPSCSISSNIITISNGFSTAVTSSKFIMFTVSSVTNPQFAVSLSNFQLTTQDSSGNTVDSVSTLSSPITYNPKVLSSVTITPKSTVNGASTTWTIATTLDYTLISGGFISLTFPNWNANLNPPSDQVKSFLSSTVTCTGILNMETNPQCSFASNILTLTVSQDAVGSIQFTINPVKNPPNTKPVSGFYLSVGQSGGLIEDSTSLTISVSTSTPGDLTSATVKFYDGNSKVNSQSIYSFDFLKTNPVPSGSNIIVTFPSEISINGFIQTIYGVFGFDSIYPNFSLSGQILTITSPISQYQTEDKVINFQVTSCKNPPSNKPTASIQILIQTSDGYSIDQITTGLSITAVAGTAKISSVVPTNTQINAVTTYAFTFNSNEAILSGCGILITAPSGISIENRDTGSCTSITSGLSSSALCSVTNNKNIYITNGFPSDFGTGNVSFSLNKITNPSTISTTGTFTLQVYIDSNFQYLISQISQISITATAGTLSSVNISPSSSTTGDIATYTFTIATSNTIPTGGILLVYLPSDISISDTTSACSFISGFESTAKCTLTSTSITITNCFAISSFSPGTLKFSLGSIQNPVSTKPTASFNIRTQTSNNLDIDYLDSGVTLTMSTAHQLSSASVSSSSLVVGGVSDYTFNITPYNPFPNNGIVVITPPSDITITQVSCAVAGSLTSSVSCSSLGTAVKLTLTFSASQVTSEFSFVLKSITNPLSTKMTSSFQISTRQNTYFIDQLTTGLTVQMTSTGAISQLSLSLGNSGINQQTPYTFTFTTSNTVKAGGYLAIQLPSQISSVASPVCSLSSGSSVSCSYLSGIVTVNMFTTDTAPGQFVLTVNSLINSASALTTDKFKLTTKTSDGFLIDSDTSLTATITCTSPCATCQNTPSTCLSCISTSSTPYFWNGVCNSACPDGQIDVSNNKICSNCDSNCKTCQYQATQCTSCVQNSKYPYLYNSKCIESCPSNTLITSDYKCVLCDQTCYTCSTTSTYCTSCIDPRYLYQNQCISSCPVDITVTIGNECVSCNTNCATCSGTANTCTSCATNKILFQGACYSSCPADISVPSESSCSACSTNCKTCSGTVGHCTSCDSSKYLYQNSCVAICPDHYFISGTSCLQCSDECLKCTGSSNYCTSCQEGLFSYVGRCVSTCPSGVSIQVGNECIKCLDSCLTCSVSYDKCTSCPTNSFLYKSECLSTCPINTFENSGICTDCDVSCNQCESSPTNCMSCASSYYKYESGCISTCPDKYVGISGVCYECDSSCATCSNTRINCTSCTGDYSLFNYVCMLTCPAGYISVSNVCTKENSSNCADLCTEELLDNDVCDKVCNVTACDYDNQKCLGPNSTDIDDYNNKPTNYSTSLYVSGDPFSISTVGGILTASTGASSIFAASAFLPSTLGVLGLLESTSWLSLIGVVNNEESTKGRALLIIDDRDVGVVFGFLISIIIIHYAMNIFFFITYMQSIRKRDIMHINWTKKHPWATILACFFSIILSFKFMRILISNFCSISGCNAKFERISRFINPMIFLTYLHIVIVTLPIIGIEIYLLTLFSTGCLTFIVAMDSLIITIFVLILSIFDIFYMKKRANNESDDKLKSRAVNLPTTIGDNTIDKNLDLDATDRTATIQDYFDNLKDTSPTKRELLTSGSNDLVFDINALPAINRTSISMSVDIEMLEEHNSNIEKNIEIRSENDDKSLEIPIKIIAKNPLESKIPNRINLKDLSLQSENDISFQMIDPLEIYENDLDLDYAIVNEFDEEAIDVKHKPTNEMIIIKKSFIGGQIVDENRNPIDPQPVIDFNDYELQKVDLLDLRFATFVNKYNGSFIKVKRNFDGAALMDPFENKHKIESVEKIILSKTSTWNSKRQLGILDEENNGVLSCESSEKVILSKETSKNSTNEQNIIKKSKNIAGFENAEEHKLIENKGAIVHENAELVKKEPSKNRLTKIAKRAPDPKKFQFGYVPSTESLSAYPEDSSSINMVIFDSSWAPQSTTSKKNP
ncbi:unnamed protein product [Blepharisma stoltei]|uniref:Uncharacterized protein n=1 Tax=Blepharisma stoltei TaxID=1481888 RepID=A0AAU9K400_9CILI|nr:unnamed protein product [Blepharisma stoltei]